MIFASSQSWRLPLLAFLGLALLGAGAAFTLPSSDQAVLEHFLSMTPWGIWRHIITTEDSPLRYAYYLPTARLGFAAQPSLWAPYALVLIAAGLGLRRAKGELP